MGLRCYGPPAVADAGRAEGAGAAGNRHQLHLTMTGTPRPPTRPHTHLRRLPACLFRVTHVDATLTPGGCDGLRPQVTYKRKGTLVYKWNISTVYSLVESQSSIVESHPMELRSNTEGSLVESLTEGSLVESLIDGTLVESLFVGSLIDSCTKGNLVESYWRQPCQVTYRGQLSRVTFRGN